MKRYPSGIVHIRLNNWRSISSTPQVKVTAWNVRLTDFNGKEEWRQSFDGQGTLIIDGERWITKDPIVMQAH